MAIIDTLKFRNILVNGKIAEEAPAEQLVTALDETLQEQLEGVATKEFVRGESAELHAEIRAMRAEITAFKAEILAAIAQSDAANARGRLTLFIAIAVLIGTAVGLIIGLN